MASQNVQCYKLILTVAHVARGDQFVQNVLRSGQQYLEP